jgi:hypothetical protein
MSEQIETTKDIGTDQSSIVRRWLRELELSDEHEKKWRERANKVIKRYRDERERAENDTEKYNILYANTEVLKGVMYQRPPTPDVRRRFKDKDPIARQAAEILNRALSYSIDAYDFDDIMRSAVEDYLLPGRANARVKYVPTYGKDPIKDATGQPMMGEDGKPQFPVVYEEARCEYVEWEMYRQSPAKRASKLRWKAYGELLTREELNSRFGDRGAKCTLDWMPEGKEDNTENQIFKRALVWMIWNKSDRKVYTICGGSKDVALEIVDDPLHLEGFFPGPNAVYAISTTNSQIPIPEFTEYQDQADELDEITGRINVLTAALKRRGVYDATYSELEKLAKAGDNEFIAIENYSNFSDKGGLEKALLEAPIEGIAKVLVGLYGQREQVKITIYEITGISDVVRGSTNASETLGAQKLKAQYGNVRTAPRQYAIQKFARDILRIKAEIISEHFSADTLKLMTGPELWTIKQKDAGTGQVVQVDITEQVMKILRDDKLRGFRVDIETDSTIQPDADTEQQNRIELLTAISGFMTQAIPAVQMGAMPMEVAKELMMFGVRSFRVGSQLEDTLDQWSEQDQEAGGQSMPNPQQAQQEAEMQQRSEMVAQKEKELESQGFQSQLERQKLDFDKQLFERDKQLQEFMSQKSGNKIAGQEMTHEENDMMGQMLGAMTQLMQQLNNTSQVMMAIVQEINKPKRLIRDRNGRAIGVEPVDMLQ